MPELQPQYLLQQSHVSYLLDSIYRGYVSYAMLTWEINRGASTRDITVDQNKDKMGFKLPTDDQQRLLVSHRKCEFMSFARAVRDFRDVDSISPNV